MRRTAAPAAPTNRARGQRGIGGDPAELTLDRAALENRRDLDGRDPRASAVARRRSLSSNDMVGDSSIEYAVKNASASSSGSSISMPPRRTTRLIGGYFLHGPARASRIRKLRRGGGLSRRAPRECRDRRDLPRDELWAPAHSTAGPPARRTRSSSAPRTRRRHGRSWSRPSDRGHPRPDLCRGR